MKTNLEQVLIFGDMLLPLLNSIQENQNKSGKKSGQKRVKPFGIYHKNGLGHFISIYAACELTWSKP
jgi:hypothetical protein